MSFQLAMPSLGILSSLHQESEINHMLSILNTVLALKKVSFISVKEQISSIEEKQ